VEPVFRTDGVTGPNSSVSVRLAMGRPGGGVREFDGVPPWLVEEGATLTGAPFEAETAAAMAVLEGNTVNDAEELTLAVGAGDDDIETAGGW
jgi:hypothetical protein